MAAQPPTPPSSTPKMERPAQCRCAPRWPSPSSNRRQCPRRQHHPVPWTRMKPSPCACTVSPRGSSTPGPRTAGAARTATLGDHTVVPLPWSTQRTMHLQTIVPQRKKGTTRPFETTASLGPHVRQPSPLWAFWLIVAAVYDDLTDTTGTQHASSSCAGVHLATHPHTPYRFKTPALIFHCSIHPVDGRQRQSLTGQRRRQLPRLHEQQLVAGNVHPACIVG
jgi:hypothetical protein